MTGVIVSTGCRRDECRSHRDTGQQQGKHSDGRAAPQTTEGSSTRCSN